jgi:acyl-CoA synthetase (NDP forming)
VFLWTGSRDAKAGLAQLKNARIPIFYTPDKLARGLQSRLAYHTWRERHLADGFATAPSRAAPQDEAIAKALGLGRPTLSESESKQLLAAWGVGSAREHRANSAEAAVEAFSAIDDCSPGSRVRRLSVRPRLSRLPRSDLVPWHQA